MHGAHRDQRGIRSARPTGRNAPVPKDPSYGVAAIVLIGAMLLLHTARSAIFDQRATTSNGVNTTKMRGDTLQYMEAKPKAGSTRPNWAQIPLQLFKQSEPFVTQSILSET